MYQLSLLKAEKTHTSLGLIPLKGICPFVTLAGPETIHVQVHLLEDEHTRDYATWLAKIWQGHRLYQD